MPLSSTHSLRALVWANLRAVRNSLRAQLAANRLMFATVAAFLGVYISVAYFMVHRGLDFVHDIALLGPLLTERLIYLLFFFFFSMLILSNATITGMGLFRRKETSWLLSLPLQHHNLVLWKTVEGMALSSWGLVLLSAPILAAVGVVLKAGPSFYFATWPALLCLIALAANLSTWLLLCVMRWLRPAVVKFLAVLLLGSSLYYGATLWPDSAATRQPDVAGNVSRILSSTEIFTHPLLPSSWVARALLHSARGQGQETLFYTACLLSHALAAALVTLWLAKRLFYPAWVQSLQPAKRSSRVQLDPAPTSWLRCLGLSRLTIALVLKDLRSFIREPAHWGQTALIFGLLFLYVTQLRRIVFDYRDGFWAAVTGHLNLLVACLSLSTLTTRFIFPQISLEGQRLWILGLSPVPLPRVMHTKLILNSLLTGSLTLGLISLSCFMLEAPLQRTALHISMIAIITLGLNTLALGLGGLFPNFHEPNPAKIVSGFGGTLCLILSFIYILLANLLCTLPSLPLLKLTNSSWALALGDSVIPWTLLSLFVLTLVFGAVPYFFATRRMKKIDLLTKV